MYVEDDKSFKLYEYLKNFLAIQKNFGPLVNIEIICAPVDWIELVQKKLTVKGSCG